MCIRKYKDEIFSECKFPDLTSPYKEALEDAVKFILKKFSVQGIIVTGSIINGKAYKSSDLDIFVVNNRYERQRIQKYFNKVPCELFINPPQIIKNEIDESRLSGDATTAHMFATGFVIYDQNQLVYKLKHKSKETIARGPGTPKLKMQMLRYHIADNYENAIDIIDEDPYMALILMNKAVFDAVLYKLREMGKWLPKDKEMMIELEKNDPELFNLLKIFYDKPSFDEKFKIAQNIIDNTVKVNGFFEWESEIEIHKE